MPKIAFAQTSISKIFWGSASRPHVCPSTSHLAYLLHWDITTFSNKLPPPAIDWWKTPVSIKHVSIQRSQVRAQVAIVHWQQDTQNEYRRHKHSFSEQLLTKLTIIKLIIPYTMKNDGGSLSYDAIQ